MFKTASALLVAVALVCGLGALALGLGTRAGLVLVAGHIYFGWMSIAVQPLRRELASVVHFAMRGER